MSLLGDGSVPTTVPVAAGMAAVLLVGSVTVGARQSNEPLGLSEELELTGTYIAMRASEATDTPGRSAGLVTASELEHIARDALEGRDNSWSYNIVTEDNLTVTVTIRASKSAETCAVDVTAASNLQVRMGHVLCAWTR